MEKVEKFMQKVEKIKKITWLPEIKDVMNI